MKKITLITIALALMLILTVSVAYAQEPNPPQLDYIDAQLAVFLPRLETFQNDYYYNNGQYYQALQSHTAPPAGVVPADVTSHPTDQDAILATLWDFAGLPDETNWSLQIDTYNGPSGPGYVLTVKTDVNGSIWIKSINYGPDTYRSADWYMFVTE